MRVMEAFTEDGWWHVDSVDDAQTLELFGTTVLPTPWPDTIDADVVISMLRKINLGKAVKLRKI